MTTLAPIGWCLIDLTTLALAQPGHDLLPPELADATPAKLADLAWHGLPGRAYWRCVEEPVPYDPETQRPGDEPIYAVDAVNRRVIARRPAVERAETLTAKAARRDLESARLAHKAAATERRKVERSKGVLHNGNRWHSDKESCDDVSTAIRLAEEFEAQAGTGAFSTPWKTLDGFATVTLAELRAAGLAVGMTVQGCFGREAALHTEIDAAETVADVLAVDISTGWP